MPAITPAKAKVTRSFKHDATLYGLALDPSGKRLYAGSEDFAVHVFDLSEKKDAPVGRWTRHESYVSAVVCLKTAVISGSYDGQLVWWDSGTGKVIRSVEAHAGWLRELVLLPDGKQLVSCGDDMLVKLWDAATGKLLRTLEGHDKRTPQGHLTALYTVAVSPDGKHLASADRHGTVIVWETATGKSIQRFEVPTLYTYDPRQRKRSIGGIRAVAFSSNGSQLAVGGIGQVGNVDGLAGPVHVEVWDWRKGEALMVSQLQGHKGIINHLEFHPNGVWLIGAGGGGDNGFLGFWKVDVMPTGGKDKKEAVEIHRLKFDGNIHHFCLNAAGTELYGAGYHKLDVWSLGT